MRLFKILTALLCMGSINACNQSKAQYQWIELKQKKIDIVVVDQLNLLHLFLNRDDQKPYQSFKALNKALDPCAIQFAMNAGMYHADYSAVGLYIERGKTLKALNQERGYGNFFMQPNGVLAWNNEQALIQATETYANSNFKAQYATQSGPMLVIDGKINPQFMPDSNSLKIRNGVGIKDNRLYFVISREPISFYAFAKVFKDDLAIDQALYLDGTVSSIYLPEKDIYKQRAKLGPILALQSTQTCSTKLR